MRIRYFFLPYKLGIYKGFKRSYSFGRTKMSPMDVSFFAANEGNKASLGGIRLFHNSSCSTKKSKNRRWSIYKNVIPNSLWYDDRINWKKEFTKILNDEIYKKYSECIIIKKLSFLQDIALRFFFDTTLPAALWERIKHKIIFSIGISQ